MRHVMRKPRGQKVRCYTACLINFNEYLASFSGATLSDKIGVTESNNILLNSMPNSWIKQAHVQGFDREHILLKKIVNMFELMDISEYIYEGVAEPSYKKTTREDSNRAGNSSQKKR